MNLYFRELKAHKKSLITWVIVLLVFISMSMQKYDAMIVAGNSEEFLKLLDSMPKFLQTMWGLSVLDITKPMGYFSVLFFYLALMAAIHAGMLGANIISKEERDKTAEFLMVKPITRSKVITSKLLAALTNVIIINLTMFAISFIILNGLTGELILTKFILLILGMFFIQLIFMSVGISISSIMKKPRSSVAITMSIILFTFILSAIIDINESFEILTFLTPFKYFEGKTIILNESLDFKYIILTGTIIIGILALAYKKYKRRDLFL